MARFLITGALGAIGAWTLRSLLERGHEVVALDLGGSQHRLAIALSEEQRAAVTHVRGDITDLAALERVLADQAITNVIHLAALQVPFVRADPVLGAQVNVTGTTNVLEAVRRHGPMGPVVYASSIAVYGPRGTLAGDDVPGTLYGVYKRANEGTAQRYFEDYGVSSIGLRPHTVFGPGRDQGVTSAPTIAMVAAAAGVPYEIPFGGRVQLQHTADAGEAFARAALLDDHHGAAVHDLDGAVLEVGRIVELIRGAAPEAAITVGPAVLPLIEQVDGSGFVDLLGESVMGSPEARIPESVRRFEALLRDGLVEPPV